MRTQADEESKPGKKIKSVCSFIIVYGQKCNWNNQRFADQDIEKTETIGRLYKEWTNNKGYEKGKLRI